MFKLVFTTPSFPVTSSSSLSAFSPQKMSKKRSHGILFLSDDDEEEDKFYTFKFLLPNSTSVTLALTNPGSEMSTKNFVNLVKKEYEKSRKNCELLLCKKRKQVDWNRVADSYLEFNGEKINDIVRFEMFKPDLCNIIRLDDGAGETSIMYENMWDLTPNTDLLKYRPENYSFDTALADLIDNSLQAVWSCSPGERRLIRVDVHKDQISIFDSGPGMDSSEANSIAKWGKIGASVHRNHKSKAVGGNPPYLMPFFGMFGYGGAYACMHLGRRTLVSSKTKLSKKVFTLQLDEEALIDHHHISGKNWKVDGGMRDPSEQEIKLSPHGSFTKVEIFEPICKIPEIYQLRCRLKDIYFPYIQNDEISKTGRTVRPVGFQVNGVDLAELMGGEVATTNLNSRGEEFWFQIRFYEKREGTLQEANARLKFVYFPVIQGKESNDIILESLEKEGFEVSESFKTFGRVSVRRLGRLLPEVPWASIPFMEKGAKASTLRRCCQRVKCFVDLDAGFSPSPSKTDLASQSRISVALKNFGSRSTENDNDVRMMIHRVGRLLSYEEVEQSYQEWVLNMHNCYDQEHASGEDDAIVIFHSLDNKSLGISPDCKAVRVHNVMKRKGTSWERGEKIKILKGACAGAHKNDIYATIDYFIIENFEDETGGDARIICRQMNISEDEGCLVSNTDGVSRMEIRRSSSFPISVIDTGKCLLIDENVWNTKLGKLSRKAPSRIDLLDRRDCAALKFNGESTVGDMVCAGITPPEQFVAVVRPGSFTSSKLSTNLNQRQIVNMEEEMLMKVELQGNNMKSGDKNGAKALYSHRSFPTSRGGFHGLYVFPLKSKIPNLFKKAGVYNFSFSIGSSITCQKRVLVSPSSKVGSWKLGNMNLGSIIVPVGYTIPPCYIACFDENGNRLSFTSVPSVEIKLKASPDFEVVIDKFEASLIHSGILKLKNMLVETGGLDQIRPDYKATLEVCSKDEPFSVSVACKVKPGPLKFAVEKNPQALENLLPDCTVEDFILEMFDGYNNHAAEGANVVICLDGYRIQDSVGLNRKVDSCGCVDLSGLLKVTAGYGKSVSLSVMSADVEIFKKESLVEKRELMLLTKLPENCVAGSNLANLSFKVIDSDGSMDTNIHHDEKSGSFHTMSIESDSSSFGDGIRYAFVHGSCKVPSLSLPETEGDFSFKFHHSRYPELHMSLKIHLTPAQTLERDETRCIIPHPRMFLTPQSKISLTTTSGMAPTQQTPSSQLRVLPMTALSLAGSSQTGMMDMVEFTETIKEKLNSYNACMGEVNERVKCLEAEQEQTIQELSALQASLGPLIGPFPECLSTKTSLMKKIEDKHHDTAAAVFCSLYRNAPTPQSVSMSRKGVFGLVALLGSVSSTSLSRVLSEYLGEDTMLALVCKSSQFIPNSAEYLMLHSEADKLGRSITNRFHVLCLDAIRPWKDGILKKDPQRRLAMVDPKLPNGDLMPGFIDFAVNMIDLAPSELAVTTSSGYGIRESLLFGLFKNLQVYVTQQHVEAALPHINGCGAVSLDGFIAIENGFIYSGCSKTEIHFPIIVRAHEEEKLKKWEAARERVTMAAKKIEEERCLLRKLEKRMKRANEKYGNATKPFLENLLLEE